MVRVSPLVRGGGRLWTVALLFVLVSWSYWAYADAPDTGLGRKWDHDIIYFALVDRFMDGDLNNNVPASSDPTLYDETQKYVNKYQGGDLRGLELALESGYFNDLGVTALWITPPVRNAWFSKYDLGGEKTGYHGYWAQDFLDIDPHLVSKTSMSGQPYSDDREGRMRHYMDFVALAHKKNIKVIQDIVCNHVGPLFYYDANGNGQFDTGDRGEWIEPYRNEGFYDDAKWADVPKWNLRPTGPGGPLAILGIAVKTSDLFDRLDTYGRKGFCNDSLGKSDGEEKMCDFFACRDIWTGPDSAFFEQLVDQFVEIYYYYVHVVGVDGLRVDTVKHVHPQFWDKFTERLRARLGEDASRLIIFGEVYCGNPRTLGSFTYRQDFPSRKDPCFDSLLDFEFCYAARDYLRVTGKPYGSPANLEKVIEDTDATMQLNGVDTPYFNPTPGLDGLNASRKMVNFVENHDGLNRFLVDGVSEENSELAVGLALTMQGIPCIYYGSEVPLRDGQGAIGSDSETGRLTLIRHGNGDALTTNRETNAFKSIAAIAKLRATLPALSEGYASSLWRDSPDSAEDDGVFAFARYVADGDRIDTKQTVVIVVNANPERDASTGYEGSIMKLVSRSGAAVVSPGEKLVQISGPSAEKRAFDILWNGSGVPQVKLTVPRRTITLFVTEAEK